MILNYYLMKNKFLYLLLFWLILTNATNAEIVEKIKVKGNVRISQETIVVFGDIELNKNYEAQDINTLSKQLYDTNFFSYLNINLINGVLEIIVKENPIIQNLVFNGIKAKKFKEAITELIELKEKSSYVENKLFSDIQKIKSAYRSLGYYFIEVEAFAKENSNNSIDLIYEIDLGDRAKIGKIQFLGDKKYKESKLRGVIVSEENKFWKVLSSKKFLNQDTIALDTRLLENFYKSKGYYQVKVLSSNVVYEKGEGFLLTYNIDSGLRFKIKNIVLNISDDLNKTYFANLANSLSRYKNSYYSPDKVKKVLDKINKLSTKKDLQFIDSKLVETIEGNNLLVQIDIFEGKKLFVERINVIGNSVTDDNVIRGEMILDEGDPFSLLLLNKSINNIRSRNIFGSVKQNSVEGTTPDLKVINIEVEEKATGEISAGAGVGSSGGTVGGSITENNFLGRGVSLNASLRISPESIRGLFSVVNPNYNYSGNSLRTTLESTKTTKMALYGYDSSKTGFSLGTTFEQWEDIFVSPELSTYYETLSTNDNASSALKKQEGSYFDTDFNYSIIQDKRDRKFQTTEGYRASFNQSVPLYSETPALLNGIDYTKYRTFNDGLIGSMRFFGRSISSLKNSEDVRLSERLNIPGKYLRGFEPGRIGPIDGDDHIGGNFATSLAFNASLPKLLPNLTKADFSLFLDTGNVWGVDYSDIIDESNKIRSAFGVSIDWVTPVGPLNFSFSEDITSSSTDKPESFRFNIGTTF